MSAATQFPRYNYIISKYADPLFALTIGLSAAALRIRREEAEKGRSGREAVAVGLRRLGVPVRWRGRFVGEGEGVGPAAAAAAAVGDGGIGRPEGERGVRRA